MPGSSPSKLLSVSLLVVAEIAGMSLWFASAAVLPDMAREAAISPDRQALLSSGVQAGFVLGALVSSIGGIADRYDPRRVFAVSAMLAALANAMLLVLPLGGNLAILARFVTGALLAGVYPVGMKIVVGWGTRDRGFLVGLLVGALTLGNGLPYLASFLGGADWRSTIVAVSALAGAGGLVVLGVGLGPHHARAPTFDPGAISLAWTDSRIRAAYLGYFGHMWELFAFWAWIGAASAVSYRASLDIAAAESLGKLTAFLTIALGALACVAAGRAADRMGKANVAIIAMAVSGTAAVLTAATFGGPVWLTFGLVMIWGIAVIPDSAQFSALVADAAPPHLAGSLMTFQTAIGFALTIVTVQMTPVVAHAIGWPLVLGGLAIGPALGIVAMLPLRVRKPA
ncbi:MAG: MFS transporter [Alphaproteobacteria bacterium]|nr:MFS transporter [Alphaproteobacteria bacterium]MBU0804003.1 MFS transporter [Alphaproteobacteria bacterium]MBU0872700.1 MFS transporter [Alphaproteobacteria bacterium]MBU1402930.1 MFS transporter [Alphaproteobacteria bacterium]MBU1593572.1 MFS transporter [Alphaproteobacteria bacterium]